VAQSTAAGQHGPLVRTASRVAMLAMEVPEAMRAGDWPEQRRIRGDLDDAVARLRALLEGLPEALATAGGDVVAAGEASVGAVTSTPRNSEPGLAAARRAAGEASAAFERLTRELDEAGTGSES
jgi:hypothetical protein